MLTRERSIKYTALLLLQCLVWGVGNPVLKIGMFTIPTFWCLCFRFGLAFVIFAALFGRRLVREWQPGRIKGCLIVSLCFSAAYILAAFALLLTSATISGFLMGLAVLFAPFINWIFFHKRPRPAVFIAVVVTAAGMYLLCGGGRLSFGWGELLSVLSSICSASMFVTTEHYVNDIGPELLSTVQTGVAAAITLVLALLLEDISLSAVAPSGWLAVLYMALFATCAACLIQNNCLRFVPALTATFIYCLEPVFSAIAAQVLLRESLPLLGLVGAGLIVAGILIASIVGSGEQTPLPQTTSAP